MFVRPGEYFIDLLPAEEAVFLIQELLVNDTMGRRPAHPLALEEGYSSQELAAAGLAPGSRVEHNGLMFTWPDAAPGTVDNIRARGQRVPLAGSGTRLGFIGASVYGSQSGTVTVEYADGGTEQAEVGFPDWHSNSGPPENVVATMNYTWRRGGRSEAEGFIYSAELPLDSGRELAAVRLPNSVYLHVFDITVGGT